MDTATVTVNGADPKQVKRGSLLLDILPKALNGLPILAAMANNDVVALDAPVMLDLDIRPLTLADPHGWQVYRRTLCFLLAKVLHERFPDINCRIRGSFGNNALFWSWDVPNMKRETTAQAIKEALADLIARDLPIRHRLRSYGDTIEHFRKNGQEDKINLLAHRNPPYLSLVVCAGFSDLPQGVMAASTGRLGLFDITPLQQGIVLSFPSICHPDKLDPVPPYGFLFDVYAEHRRWGEIIGVRSAGELNAAIADGSVADVMNTVEALHEKRFANIADLIAARVPRPRVVLIAGPSSAGKTTSAMRLCTHLRVIGLRPTLISTDNYFVGDERNPRDADGTPDYEHIDAVDRPLLNADILALLDGKTVPMRKFDFINHRSGTDESRTLTLDPRLGVLVIEGLHSLNPDLTPDIPDSEKFLIYVNALTQLSIDSNNRISTIDNRLLRRIVRDGQFRGRSILETLKLWPKVRAGEERWIFPFQHNADAVFNTALDYEIPVLKTLASPLLNQVKPWHPEFAVARRLTCFLQNFMSMPMADVPTNSILREYLGASRLKY